MSSAKELGQIARDLVNSSSPWFKGNRHYFSVLQAFIRDEGICVYCGKDLWEKFGIASCGDHLLPEGRYSDREHDVDNLVAACAECNGIKRDYDPSDRKDIERPIPEQVRLDLVRKAREEIDRRTNTADWRNEFQTAKRLFGEAVEKYRKCKETDRSFELVSESQHD